MKRLKGPQLKLGKPKAPAFLADLYYDLRDRRLLPLVALVVVAIAAVPFLLGEGSEGLPEPAPGDGPIAALKEAEAKASALTVVEARPGLRDYRRRLRDRTPTDPFHQRYTAPSLKGAELKEPKGESATQDGGEGTSTGESASGESAPAPAGSDGGQGASGGAPAGSGKDGGDGGGGGGAQPSPGAVLYSFGVDLRIVHISGSDAAGDKAVSEPDVRKRVLPTTSLPSKQNEVVTYMGLSPKTRKPLFLVSTEVSGVFGEGACVSGSESCQLIELEPGFPETFELGEAGERYKITVTDVDFIVTGRL